MVPIPRAVAPVDRDKGLVSSSFPLAAALSLLTTDGWKVGNNGGKRLFLASPPPFPTKEKPNGCQGNRERKESYLLLHCIGRLFEMSIFIGKCT